MSPETTVATDVLADPAAAGGETFVGMLLDVVAAQPSAPAVEGPHGALTYDGLLARARSIAAALRSAGVQPGDRVAVSIARGHEWPAAVVGVWLAGATYVPTDPAHPADRRRYAMADAGCVLLLAGAGDPGLAEGPPVLAVETIPAGGSADTDRLPSPGDDAYVIYTSGSTGRPKGVLVSHRGIGLLARAQGDVFGVRRGTRVLQFASIGFDASISELAVTLAAGGTLVFAEQPDMRPVEPLTRTLRDARIDLVTLPPSVLALLPQDEFPAGLSVVVAGEACPPELLRRIAAVRPIFNAYGPTEATVCATVRRCDGTEQGSNIGWPLPYVELEVADERGEPVADGVAGELLIGGPQLAAGYLGSPELTAAAFVDTPRGRRYRTGDYGVRRGDGSIDFAGRADDQVQVRGQRVELGEVRSVLMRCPQVRDAAVVVVDDDAGQGRLVAYVVPAAPGDVAAVVRDHARAQLIPAMVPAAVVPIAELPLTANGKLDKEALPSPFRAASGVADSSPEGQVRAIWQRLLEIDEIGADDDFFDLGGDSLLAAQVAEAVKAEIGADVEVHALFEQATLREFIALVLERRGTARQRPQRFAGLRRGR